MCSTQRLGEPCSLRGVSWWAHPPDTHKKVTFCFFFSFYHCFSSMQTPDSRCCSVCSWCSRSCGALAAPQAPWLWHMNLIFLSCFMLMLPRLEPGFCFSRRYMGNTKTVFGPDSSNSKKAENKCLCLRFRALSHVLFGLFESRPTEMIGLHAFLLPFSLELVLFFYILVLFCNFSGPTSWATLGMNQSTSRSMPASTSTS